MQRRKDASLCKLKTQVENTEGMDHTVFKVEKEFAGLKNNGHLMME
jgi:hypothetical protein